MIPKIIHHVWPGADPFKAKYHEWRLSWMRHHPDWQFRFWRGNEPTLDTLTRQAMADPQGACKEPHRVTGVWPFTDICHKHGVEVMGKEAFYPVAYFERHLLADYKPGPHTYALHHWSGMDADGWTRQEVRP